MSLIPLALRNLFIKMLTIDIPLSETIVSRKPVIVKMVQSFSVVMLVEVVFTGKTSIYLGNNLKPTSSS